MKVRTIGLLLAGLCLSAPGVAIEPVRAQDAAARPAAGFDVKPIGKVLKATGAARIEHPAGILVQANLPPDGGAGAKPGEFVYRGDVIQTGTDGALSIAFIDGTSLNISANARMEVNEFIYDPKGNANSALMSVSKGTFAFIAGAVAHTGNMKIDTPLATMGIRGTAPRIEVSEDGTVKFSTLIEQK